MGEREKGNDRGHKNRRKREDVRSEGERTEKKEGKVHVINIH